MGYICTLPIGMMHLMKAEGYTVQWITIIIIIVL